MRRTLVRWLFLTLVVVGNGCVYGIIAGTKLVEMGVGKVAFTEGFRFDSVTWSRTADDSNRIVVRGMFVWTKSRMGAGNRPYWDRNTQNTWGVDLLGADRKVMATLYSEKLTVWDGVDEVTSIPTGKPMTFEMRTSKGSPNIMRKIASVNVQKPKSF